MPSPQIRDSLALGKCYRERIGHARTYEKQRTTHLLAASETDRYSNLRNPINLGKLSMGAANIEGFFDSPMPQAKSGPVMASSPVLLVRKRNKGRLNNWIIRHVGWPRLRIFQSVEVLPHGGSSRGSEPSGSNSPKASFPSAAIPVINPVEQSLHLQIFSLIAYILQSC